MGIIDNLKSNLFRFFFDVEELKQTTKEIDDELNKNAGAEFAVNKTSSYIEETLDEGIYGYSTRSELLQTKGFTEAERCKKDAQVKANLDMLIFSVTGKNFVINSFDDNEESKHLKEFIEFTLDSVDGSIQDMLYEVCLGIFYGYSILEKVYKICDFGKFANTRIYKAFKAKRPGAYGFILDDYDNILAVQSLINSINLPKEKFIIYSWKKEFSNPYGSATFDSVWKFWWAKSEIIKQMLIGVSKNASGMVVAKIPNGADSALINSAKNVVSNALANAGIIIPESLQLEFVSKDGKSQSDIYINSLKWLDSQIALAIVGNALTTNESQSGGSYAQSKVQSGVSSIYSKYLEKTIEELVNEQIIKPLIKFNFGNVENYPTFQIIADEQKNLTEFNTNAEKLVNMGAIDLNNENDLNKVREFNDFAIVDSDYIEQKKQNQTEQQTNINLDNESNKVNNNSKPSINDIADGENYSIDYDNLEFQFIDNADNDNNERGNDG